MRDRLPLRLVVAQALEKIMLNRIRMFVTAPVFEDEDETRTARLLYVVLLTFFVAIVLVIVASLIADGLPSDSGDLFLPLSSIILAVVMGGLLACVRRGYLRWPSIIFLFLLWAVVTLWMYLFVRGVSGDMSVLIYALIIVLSGLLLGKRGAIACTVVVVMTLLGLHYAEVGYIVMDDSGSISFLDLLFIIMPIAMIGVLLSYAMHNMEQALERRAESNRELQVIRASLEQQNERLRVAVQEYVAYMVEVTHGNLSARLTFDEDDGGQRDPLITLGDHLNEMTASLQHTIDQERAQREVIEVQQQAIRELLTPIIPVVNVPRVGSIIVLPLIGVIDTTRARNITRRLLAGIREHRAKVVILDITGVPIVDTSVADYLTRTVQAARLKGAQVVVTGISDVVAETVVDLGIDWSGVETSSDLQMGLLIALDSLGFRLESFHL